MKYGSFLMKFVCLVGIFAILFTYQKGANVRAAVIEKNEAEIAEVEAYNEEVEKAMAASSDEPGQNSPFADGEYEGSGSGYGGTITVKVTVEDGVMTAIDVTAHDGEDPAYYSIAEPILEDMLDAQDNAVDAKSGATFSSNGLIDAVGEALDQAEAANE